mgnify:CR=1 FL=1
MVRKRLSQKQRKQIYNMFDGHCAYCGCTITMSEMQVDHILSLHRGGTDDISNMYPACRSCNKYKDTYTIEGLRKAIEHIPDVLKRDSSTYRIAVRFGLIKLNKDKVKFYFEECKNV